MMAYIQYTIVLIFSIMGVFAGIYFAYYLMRDSILDMSHPAKIIKRVPNPTKNDERQVAKEKQLSIDIIKTDTENAKKAKSNLIIDRLSPEKTVMIDEENGATAQEAKENAIKRHEKEENAFKEIQKKKRNNKNNKKEPHK